MRLLRWLVPLLIALAACSSESAPTPTAGTAPSTSTSGDTSTSLPAPEPPPADERTLRVGSVAPVASLDPADAFTLSDWELLHAIGVGLLFREPGNGRLLPGIAEELPRVDDDGRTYTFRLRPDVTFADGLPLTAPVYVDAIRRVMALGGQGSDLVTAYVAQVEAPDDATVVFRLHDDFAFFPTLVAGGAYLPAHPDDFPPDALQPFPEAPIYGVGPWFIESMDETHLELRPNPMHHEAPSVERVVVTFFPTVQDAISAMVEGTVDILWRGLDAEASRALVDVEEISVAEVPGGTLQFLVLNHALAPTDDPLVRRAIAEVVDRSAITDGVLGGRVEPVYSPIPPGFLGAAEPFLDRYGAADVTAAIELLTEAGYTTESPAHIELAYPPEQYGVHLAEAMEEVERQIESTGLVEVTLTAQPWNAYLGDVVTGAYNIAFLGWLHDFPDPHNYIAPFVMQGGIGGSGASVAAETVALVDEAAGEDDETQRASLYLELQQRFADDVVTLPLWIDHPYVAYWRHVSGDPSRPHPETLNIGETLILDYRVVRLDR